MEGRVGDMAGRDTPGRATDRAGPAPDKASTHHPDIPNKA